MRSLRLVAAILALALVAAACSDDGEGENGEETPEVPTTTRSTGGATTSQPPTTPPTTAPEEPAQATAPEPGIETEPEIETEPGPADTSVARPPPPSNTSCEAGTAENELFVEFDALPNPSDISKIRTYLRLDGQQANTNGEFTIGELDTTRDGGSRWAAPVRRVPANTPVTLYVTSFNQLGQESGWYGVEGSYTAPGAPCGAAAEPELPPTTCTAGCDEEEGEPAA